MRIRGNHTGRGRRGAKEREIAGSRQPVLSRVETGKSGEPGDKSLVVTLLREPTAYSGSMDTLCVWVRADVLQATCGYQLREAPSSFALSVA